MGNLILFKSRRLIIYTLNLNPVIYKKILVKHKTK